MFFIRWTGLEKALKLYPNIDLVVAEMDLFRRGLLSMYSHHDPFRESQSLAQQKDSLHRKTGLRSNIQ